MTLTPQQRLEAYEWAKISVAKKPLNRCFVCNSLICWVVWETFDCSKIDIACMFPEFYSQKPNKIREDGSWWTMSASGRIRRLAALDRAIELVKEKI